MTYFARVDYTYTTGDGVFTIPFSYIKKEHIKVEVNRELITSYIFISESQIKITSALEANDIVTIRRETAIDKRLVVFSNSSILNKDDQNLAVQQTFNVVQELYDSVSSTQFDVRADIETLHQNIVTTFEGVFQAAAMIESLQESVESAITAAEEATEKAEEASETAQSMSDALEHKDLTDNPHNVTKAQVGLSNCDNTSDLNKPISTATQTALNAKLTYQAGMIGFFAGQGSPVGGWLYCDGSSKSKTTYPALFNAIGYTYGGSGDSFNVPDLRAKFIFGSATAGSTTSATSTNTSSESSHTHKVQNITTGSSFRTSDTGSSHHHTYTKGVNGFGLRPYIKT